MISFPNTFLTISGLSRGKSTPSAVVGISLGLLPWPTDPIGTTTVTFDGVHAGSEIRVYLSDMTELAGVESSTDNPSLAWSVYANGSANNTVRIVIVHPNYRIKEFTYTSSVGNQTIPVQQEVDKWFSNPA